MADLALSSVNALLGVLNEMKQARQEVLLQQKRTKILVTGLKQGLLTRQTLTGANMGIGNNKKEDTESSSSEEDDELNATNRGGQKTKEKPLLKKGEGKDGNKEEKIQLFKKGKLKLSKVFKNKKGKIRKDEVMINLKNSIDEACTVFKTVNKRNCITGYVYAKKDLENMREAYDLLQVAYDSLEKEMHIIESAKQQRDLKNQLAKAKEMYENLTSQTARTFIENYFKENFHSIPMVELSKKFIEFVQSENLNKESKDKFPLVNLEPEFQKYIGGNPEAVDIGRINNFYENVWDDENNKMAFKDYLIKKNQKKIDEYLLVFQILESIGLKHYFQLFKQQLINSHRFLLLRQKDIITGFGNKITNADACSIGLAIKQFLQEKEYYMGIKDKAAALVEDGKQFYKEILHKKESGQLKVIPEKEYHKFQYAQLENRDGTKVIHALGESLNGHGGVYLESERDIRICYLVNWQVVNLYPVVKIFKYRDDFKVYLIEYLHMDQNNQKQGYYYTRKQEEANGWYYQEQYIETLTPNPIGDFTVETQVMKGVTVDTKTNCTMYGEFGFNEKQNSLVHGKQVQFTFDGNIRMAYFDLGTEISFQEYKQKFGVEEQIQFRRGKTSTMLLQDPSGVGENKGSKNKLEDIQENVEEEGDQAPLQANNKNTAKIVPQ